VRLALSFFCHTNEYILDDVNLTKRLNQHLNSPVGAKYFGCIGMQSTDATVSSLIPPSFITNYRRKPMKKSQLTLAALALTAMAITSCASKPQAETSTVSSQKPDQSLNAALETASTPAEKADILSKAAAEAALEAANAKAEAEAKTSAAEKAPGILAKKAKEEASKAQAAAVAAKARAELLAKQAAEAAAIAAAESAMESEPAAE
jgi:hypothetical protein